MCPVTDDQICGADVGRYGGRCVFDRIGSPLVYVPRLRAPVCVSKSGVGDYLFLNLTVSVKDLTFVCWITF